MPQTLDQYWSSLVFSRDGWIPSQTRLFSKVTKVLHSDQLARLVHIEPVQRRLVVDKTAKRLRQIYAGVSLFKVFHFLVIILFVLLELLKTLIGIVELLLFINH